MSADPNPVLARTTATEFVAGQDDSIMNFWLRVSAAYMNLFFLNSSFGMCDTGDVCIDAVALMRLRVHVTLLRPARRRLYRQSPIIAI